MLDEHNCTLTDHWYTRAVVFLTAQLTSPKSGVGCFKYHNLIKLANLREDKAFFVLPPTLLKGNKFFKQLVRSRKCYLTKLSNTIGL